MTKLRKRYGRIDKKYFEITERILTDRIGSVPFDRDAEIMPAEELKQRVLKYL
jgi:hypothetical protein